MDPAVQTHPLISPLKKQLTKSKIIWYYLKAKLREKQKSKTKIDKFYLKYCMYMFLSCFNLMKATSISGYR